MYVLMLNQIHSRCVVVNREDILNVRKRREVNVHFLVL